METQDHWVGVDDVASHLSVRKESVYRWIDKKGLPAHRAGRLFRFKLSEVDEWMRDGDGAGALKKAKMDEDYAGKSAVIQQVQAQSRRLAARMAHVKHKIAVLSGKGGVGKSQVTVNLATALAMRGHRVGILDADINGPSIPAMLGITSPLSVQGNGDIAPAVAWNGIRVASMQLLLCEPGSPVRWKAPSQAGEAIWKGALETSVLREFLADFDWGDLDHLLVDLPPGTGDKPAAIAQLIPDLAGAVVVTIPSRIACDIVTKSIRFIRQLGIPVFGLVENMVHFACPNCKIETELFARSSAKDALPNEIPVLARIPFDPGLSICADEGRPFLKEHPDAPAAKAFAVLANTLEGFLEERENFVELL